MAESHIEKKGKRDGQRPRKTKEIKWKKIIYNKAKGLSKEKKKERKHKVLKYAKGIRLKKKREM